MWIQTKNFTLVIAIVLGSLMPTVAGGQISTALIREGDSLTVGEQGSTITAISNTAAARHRGYAFTVTTDGSFANVWGNIDGGPGEILASEVTIGNLDITALESFFGISDTGAVCYGTTSTDLISGTTGLDGVFRNSVLLLNEGQAVPTIKGYFSTFNSRPGITADGQPYWVGGITDTKGGGTDDRVLFMGTDLLPVLRGGDPIMGVDENVDMEGIDFDVRFSACGSNYIMVADILPGTTDDTLVVINGEAVQSANVVMREGNLIPDEIGGIGDSYAAFDFLGVTESGKYLVTGNTDAASGFDEFIMIDGIIILREGDMLGPNTLTGAIESAFMNQDGDWAAIWDADFEVANLEVLIFNGDIVAAQGDLVDWNGDGVVDGNDSGATLDNFTGISSMTMTRVDVNGMLSIYFTADCDVNGETLEGGFELRVPGNPIMLGDLNGDGIVSLLDVAPYVKVLNSAIYHPAGDFNGDNAVTLLDLDGFIQFLQGDG